MHYLDNAATSWPKPESVYQELDTSFRNMFSAKRGTAKAARAGKEKLSAARKTVADFFGITDPSRLSFTSGCTHSLNMAIQAFPFEKGDGVVISAIEHHALSRPVRKMAREKGIEFYVVPYTDEVPFDLTVFDELLATKPNIKLVATTHASNVIGSVLPVAEIGKRTRTAGKVYLVDGAQTAGVYPVDVEAMNIDMLAIPGHKSLYGPPGVGALYIGERVQLNTFMEGGTGNDSGKHEMRAVPPDGFETGTIALPQILSFAKGIEWVNEQGLENIHHHEIKLLKQLLDGLNTIEGVTIYGHQNTDQKTPVVSFNIKDADPNQMGAILFDEYDIALRAGFHCAPMAHEAIGTINRGTIRASIGYTTTEADVSALIEAVKAVSSKAALVG